MTSSVARLWSTTTFIHRIRPRSSATAQLQGIHASHELIDVSRRLDGSRGVVFKNPDRYPFLSSAVHLHEELATRFRSCDERLWHPIILR
jgi:hypothetical protein